MNWKLIKKDKANQPARGTYSDWKNQIADECFKQCVYCSIHEAQFGGIDHYHIDHFKPQSKYPTLIDDILNLFYACPVCNRFKSDDWPGDPNLDHPSYINPSEVNYRDLFELNDRFELEGKYVASRYITLRLFLNRAQLIFERREFISRSREMDLRQSINELIKRISIDDPTYALEVLLNVTQVYSNLLDLEQRKREIRPYELAEIRRV